MTSKTVNIKHTWIWEKCGTTYNATLYRNTFIVRNMNITGIIILKIQHLTTDSQKNIISNMHRIKLSLECDA
jgi:hypothetical protein